MNPLASDQWQIQGWSVFPHLIRACRERRGRGVVVATGWRCRPEDPFVYPYGRSVPAVEVEVEVEVLLERVLVAALAGRQEPVPIRMSGWRIPSTGQMPTTACRVLRGWAEAWNLQYVVH